MDGFNQDAYDSYFGRKSSVNSKQVTAPRNPNETVYINKESARIHDVEKHYDKNYDTQTFRNVADNNIDDIEQIAEILKKLCNAAWGHDWGEFSTELKKGEDSSTLILPQITIGLNDRDISESMGGLKPVLTDVANETDGEGNPTGDAFLIYRQWFDCVVEFNVYGRTMKEAREIKKKFESLLAVYAGYLKRQGISEILFEREVPAKSSLNYDESSPMCCIYYYIRLESITSVRQSLINTINAEIGANSVSADKVRQMIADSKTGNVDPVEIDFFSGDNGITYDL